MLQFKFMQNVILINFNARQNAQSVSLNLKKRKKNGNAIFSNLVSKL